MLRRSPLLECAFCCLLVRLVKAGYLLLSCWPQICGLFVRPKPVRKLCSLRLCDLVAIWLFLLLKPLRWLFDDPVVKFAWKLFDLC